MDRVENVKCVSTLPYESSWMGKNGQLSDFDSSQDLDYIPTFPSRNYVAINTLSVSHRTMHMHHKRFSLRVFLNFWYVQSGALSVHWNGFMHDWHRDDMPCWHKS